MADDATMTPGLTARYASWPARLRVFVVALILLVLGATGLCVLVAMKTFTLSPALFALWYSILAGPFSAIWILPEQANWTTIGMVNLVAAVCSPHLAQPCHCHRNRRGVCLLVVLGNGCIIQPGLDKDPNINLNLIAERCASSEPSGLRCGVDRRADWA